jgi:ABC-type multidrug transport system ATPase subunit
MLQLINISSGYGKKQVLYDVSINVDAGETVLLSGGNGSGKSTLLKCIYNLLPLWSGEIWFKENRIDRLKTFELIKRGIVYIPQKDFCFENLTVEENLQISGSIYPKSELRKRLNKVYDYTGLEPFKKRRPFNLSGGEKKILAFGMGLIHEPKLILFDEPLAGVDIKNTSLIIDKILAYKSVTYLIIEHRDIKTISTNEFHLSLGKLKNNQL